MINFALWQASELIDISVDTPAAAITNTMETALAEPPRLEMEALYLQQIKNAITYLSKLEMDAWIIKKLMLGNPMQ